RFEEALHAYFRIGEISKVRLSGLDGVHYLDKPDSNREKTQQGDIVIASETDRVYLNTTHAIALEDSVLHRRIRVNQENSRTTVVWNPWSDRAKALSDLGEGEWKYMVCIETSNVAAFAVELAPGAEHTMTAKVGVG